MSIQSHLMSIGIRLNRRKVKKKMDKIGRFDPLVMRRGFEKRSGVYPMPKGIIANPLMIGNTPASWLEPEEKKGEGILLYLHGGGYIIGSIKSHRPLAAKICQISGNKGLIIDYRLAPEFPFPAALDDAIKTYRWLLDEGYEAKNIAIAGDSAGGGLTLATLQRIRDLQLPSPCCGICFSPWVDLSRTSNSYKKKQGSDPMLYGPALEEVGQIYAGDIPKTEAGISPIFGNFRGLPPLKVFVGTAEILHDEGIKVVEIAKKSGVEAELSLGKNMFHVWPYFWAHIPEAKAALKEAAEFFNFNLAKQNQNAEKQ